jgi:RNA polymerase II-associated factor 1
MNVYGRTVVILWVCILISLKLITHIASSELNPDPDNLAPVDPRDEFMLEGFSAQAGMSRQSSQSTSGSQPLHVSWLRRTEYVTAKDSASRVQALAR